MPDERTDMQNITQDEMLQEEDVQTAEEIDASEEEYDSVEQMLANMDELDFREMVLEYLQDLDERVESLQIQQKEQLNDIGDAVFELHRMLIMYQGLIEGIYTQLTKKKLIDTKLVHDIQKEFVQSFVESFSKIISQLPEEETADAVEGRTHEAN